MIISRPAFLSVQYNNRLILRFGPCDEKTRSGKRKSSRRAGPEWAEAEETPGRSEAGADPGLNFGRESGRNNSNRSFSTSSQDLVRDLHTF